MAGTPEQVEAICNGLASGKSLRKIAREMDMAESTLRYWLSSDPDAFAHSARARELGCDALADECLEIADGSEPSDVKRIRIDTRLRLIGKWSQRYGDRVTVDSHSRVTHSYDFSGVPDEDLAELERIVGAARSSGGDTAGALSPPPDSVH